MTIPLTQQRKELPMLSFVLAYDQIKNFLCKGNDKTTCQGHDAFCSLA
jgi:hypothetical protein